MLFRSVIFIIFIQLGLIVTDAGVISTPIQLWGLQLKTIKYQYTLGILAAPLYIFALLMIISTLLKAWSNIKSNHDTNPHGSITLVSLGIAIVFIGTLGNLIPAVGQYPVEIFASFINAFLLMIAIYKYRLVELRFMVTRGLVSGLFIVLLIIAYVFSVIYIEKHISAQYRGIIPYYTTLVALIDRKSVV